MKERSYVYQASRLTPARMNISGLAGIEQTRRLMYIVVKNENANENIPVRSHVCSMHVVAF
jgi:hypothetical protein